MEFKKPSWPELWEGSEGPRPEQELGVGTVGKGQG